MKSFYRLLIASIISIGIAAALSIVPKLDGTLRIGSVDAPVFSADKTLLLTDRNLVDLLTKLPLHLTVARVEWNDSILSIDLKGPADRTSPGSIYDDLYTLARLGFAGTSNVKQLLVRVLEQPAAKSAPELLVAMDAKRDDLKSDSEAKTLTGKEMKERYLSSHFNLTYTHKWLDRYRP